jgi:large subunit ribosomal protein L29
MPALKMEDIRGMSPEERDEKVAALKKRLLDLRVELVTGKLEKHGEIRQVKKSIARLLTAVNGEKAKAILASKTKAGKGS